MNRILVIRGGAIGDFVLTLPALKLLRETFPAARIEILGYKHIAALAERRFYADAVRSIEYGPLSSFFAQGSDLSAELTGYFSGFDLIVSYLFDRDQIFERNVRRCGVENFLSCPAKVTGREHAALELARPLAKLGIEILDGAARLYPSAADRTVAADLLGNRHGTIALHPGSGSDNKNWPIGQWLQLSERVMEAVEQASLLVAGGEADATQLASMRAAFQPRAVLFAENLPLPHLAATLERCAIFIGHDSGVSHIAAAVGTPSVLLFGPTDPEVWAPANSKVQVLRAATKIVADISLEEVEAAIRYELMRIGIST